MKNKKFVIEINDDSISVNNKTYRFDDTVMDNRSKEDDLNKKAIFALAREMGYEPEFLFEDLFAFFA